MTVLERIVELTQRVEEHVSGGHWLEAAAVEAERKTLIEAFVAEDLAQGLGGRNIEALREVVERDAKTLSQVYVLRDALLSEFKRLSDSSRVSAAYAESAGGRTR